MLFEYINNMPHLLVPLDKKVCEKCKKEYFQYSLDKKECDCSKKQTNDFNGIYE